MVSNPVLIKISEGTIIVIVVAAKFSSKAAVITLFSSTLGLEDVISFLIRPFNVLVMIVKPLNIVKPSEVSTVSKYSDGWIVGGF